MCVNLGAGFIKCDAEGAEVEVFRGAKLLNESRPIILCEMHGEKTANAEGI
jgi:hypothetical protein